MAQTCKSSTSWEVFHGAHTVGTSCLSARTISQGGQDVRYCLPKAQVSTILSGPMTYLLGSGSLPPHIHSFEDCLCPSPQPLPSQRLYCLPTNHGGHHRAGSKMATPSSTHDVSSRKRALMPLPYSCPELNKHEGLAEHKNYRQNREKMVITAPPTLLDFKGAWCPSRAQFV